MISSLQVRWMERLETAQLDTSWRAQMEKRVLRFLLSRYDGSNEEAPLVDFPFYESAPVHGRTKSLLSPREQEQRLNHIAQENPERTEIKDLFINDYFESVAWRDVKRRRRKAAFEAAGQKPPPFLPYGPQWLQWDIGRAVITFLARSLRPRR